MRNEDDRAKNRERILKKARSYKAAGTRVSIMTLHKQLRSNRETIREILEEEGLLSILDTTKEHVN